MAQPHGKTSAAYLDGLQHTLVTQLLRDCSPIEHASGVLRIGLDASHKVRASRVDLLHEFFELLSKLSAYSVLTCAAYSLTRQCLSSEDPVLLLEALLDKFASACFHASDEVSAKFIHIFIKEAL
jgi:hypothetical protein